MCFLSNVGFSQNDYSFRYKIDANEAYKNVHNKKNTNPYEIYGISKMRKHFYSTVYLNGVANQQYLECEYDLTQFLEGFAIKNDSNGMDNYDMNIGGFIKTDTMTFSFTHTVKYFCNKLKSIGYNINDDTINVNSVRKIKLDSFEKTNETEIINDLMCQKWIPTDTNISEKIAIWISNEVPKEVNFGIFCPDFDGGIVKVEWSNGRFNSLVGFKKLDAVYHYKIKDFTIDSTQSKKELDYLRGALIENDSMEVIKQ